MVKILMLVAIIAAPFGGVWFQTALLALAGFLLWAEMREKEQAEARERVALDRAELAEERLRNMAAARGYDRQVSVVVPALPSPDDYPSPDRCH